MSNTLVNHNADGYLQELFAAEAAFGKQKIRTLAAQFFDVLEFCSTLKTEVNHALNATEPIDYDDYAVRLEKALSEHNEWITDWQLLPNEIKGSEKFDAWIDDARSTATVRNTEYVCNEFKVQLGNAKNGIENDKNSLEKKLKEIFDEQRKEQEIRSQKAHELDMARSQQAHERKLVRQDFDQQIANLNAQLLAKTNEITRLNDLINTHKKKGTDIFGMMAVGSGLLAILSIQILVIHTWWAVVPIILIAILFYGAATEAGVIN